MKYQSSRGGYNDLSFEKVLFSGYAPDGGLFVPQVIPKVDKETLKSWSHLSYIDLAKEFLPMFIDETEIPKLELSALIDEAFSLTRFDIVAPLRNLRGFHVLELFHGPTLAFKDLALGLTGRLLDYFVRKKSRHVTVLVGTSGDTGSASIEAVRGSSFVDIIVLLPRGRCSEIQERQMTSVIEDNVHVYRVDSTSDDLDVPIKNCFDDESYTSQHNLISLNSINWARVLIQAIHFIFAFLKFNPQLDDKEIEFLIPTGACGNISGGCLAVMMGVPMKFVAAVNSNDIVGRAIQGGDFSLAKTVQLTLAPSIDIQVPYNMERIYYFCLNGDSKEVKKIMDKFEDKGSVVLPSHLNEKIQSFMSGITITNSEIVTAIQRVASENNGYVLCPHSAVAAAAYHKRLEENKSKKVSIVVATASPAKFPEAMAAAGLDPVVHPRIEQVMKLDTNYQDLEVGEDWNMVLKTKIEEITMKNLQKQIPLAKL